MVRDMSKHTKDNWQAVAMEYRLLFLIMTCFWLVTLFAGLGAYENKACADAEQAEGE